MNARSHRAIARLAALLGFPLFLALSAPSAWAAPTANGRIVYSVNTTTPQHRAYTASTNSFSAAAATVAGAAPSWVVARAAPTRNEHIAGYVTTGGVLYIYRWNGASWINETSAGNGWGATVTVNGNGVDGRRFDIAYENTTGNCMVVYSTNAATTNELAYRIWNGSSWSAATNLDPTRLTYAVSWVKLVSRPGSNEITLGAQDIGSATANHSSLTVMTWTGAAWGNEPATSVSSLLQNSTTPQVQIEGFDIAYESLSGDRLIAYTQPGTTAGIYCRTYNTGGNTLGTATSMVTFTSPAIPRLSSDPNSDQILVVYSRNASANIYGRIWSGTALGGSTTLGTNSVNPASVEKRQLEGGWLRSGSTSFPVVFWQTGTATTMNYRVCTSTSTPTWATAGTLTIAAAAQWIDVDVDPVSQDTLMLTFSDSASDLWAKRVVTDGAGALTITNADGGTALTTTLASITSQNFCFAYDRTVNSTTAGTVTAAATSGSCTGITATAPYTNDANANNTLSYRYRTPTGTGTWSAATPVAHSASPYTVNITGLTFNATYDVEVTYVDADGVMGTAVQTASNILVGPNCTGAGTVTAAQTPGATPSIAVSAPYTGDANANNTLSYRYRTPTGTGAWTVATPVAHGASPYAFAISGLTCGSSYDVEVTYLDANGIGSGTAVQTVSNVVLTNCTVTGTATATGGSCGSIAVTAPCTQDADGDNTLSYRYRTPTGTGTWTGAIPVLHSASPYSFTIGSLAAGSYDVEVTYVDADGVSGTNPRTVTNITVTASCTTVGTAAAVPTTGSCTSISVTAPYTGDSNANNTLSYRYRTPSGTGAWVGPTTRPHSASPYSFAITGLTAGATYDVEVTYVDADGVSGTAIQLIGPITVPDCRVIPGAPTAVVNSCNQIAVSAPYTGDGNGNSTTTTSRGPSATGPWTAVCTSAIGASPRACTDNGVAASSTYYYQVTFADPDGIVGTNPQVIGPYMTPACAVNNTTPGTASAAPATCTTATVTATFTGDANNNGTFTVETGPSNTGPWTAFTGGQAGGPSPRQLLVTGLTASTTYWFRVTFADPDGVIAPNPIVTGAAITTPACGGDTVAPTATMLVPTEGAVTSGIETFKVQAYDASGTAGLTVQYQLDSTTGAWTAMALNATYPSCGTNCAIYTATLAAAPLAGAHYLAVKAADAAGNATVVTTGFTATASGSGTGTLLRRTHGSELCIDCHNLETHNSQYTSTTYGSWSVDCLTCHTPHKTRNIHLVRESITTPNSGNKAVDFRNVTGVAANSFATPQASGNGVGVCEICHTKTKNSDATPRARNNAATDWTKHYTTNCVSCHSHGKGFAAGESEGNANCSGCHKSIWDRMQATGGSTYKHTLAVDTFTDDTVAWGSPLNGNAAASRSCLNMCHDDHPHTATDDPSPALHYNFAYDDAASQLSRAATTRTVATKAKTDFDNTLANGGMCVSCHKNPVESGATPAHPALVQANYAASAHNTTSTTPGGAWQYTLHDGSNFTRNCTKCHWDSADGTTPAVSGKTAVGAVHGNTNPSLLAGTTNPNGTPSTFVCYNCHGNGTTGTNYSNKDIATQIAKTRNHPSNADNVHSSFTEFYNAAFGNTLGVTGRHANCLDCHHPHEAKTGLSPSPGNTAGGALNGAWGARLSTSPAFWTDTAAGNFTKETLVSGTSLEATLCFKCHTKYYWGAGTPPTAPSGGTETDVAKEFNPGNVGNWGTAWANGKTAGSFHPVLATAGGNLGAVRLTNLVTTNFPWSTTARNLMTCSDCHASNTTTDPGGPHGSTANYILKGPNTAWNATITNADPMPATVFCANCHPTSWTNSRFDQHSRGDHYIPCWNCHSAIPHGGPRPGFLVAGAGANANVGGIIAGWDQTAPYWQGGASNRLYLVSYPANATTNWAQGNCGCNGTGH